ncbi:M23 family metallopeptidase [Lacihabitans soyangensis]|uniref:M23 family metallopeptidase n=1 Tax=Lacihabitans soyangensis TaxID=869394 RepID=A0AAE3H5G4_9BACT|nr:M23 family metallopeptidase [Lacihabitans soyangensis]MCP9764396.1 M23 family metallopeptidase [Lacihabitans soyangensis]
MLLNILFAIFSVFSLKTDASSAFSFSDETDVFPRYKKLLVDIREQNITPLEAENEFKSILGILKKSYPNTLDSSQIGNFVFPLTQSDYSAVGGNGSGFYIKNFNLFDHSVSGSHPAHDIFIYDPDQDCKDNRKQDYVDIVSVGNGVVLAVEKDWTDSSEYRGGNYVWVFDFERGGLWYYAHHRKVVVEIGQIVKPGDKLGEVGRTGFNAKNKRSDTHLHLMYLELDQDYYPKPKNYYVWLKNAETIRKSTQAEGIKRLFFGKLSLIKPLPPKKIAVRNFDLKVKRKRV